MAPETKQRHGSWSGGCQCGALRYHFAGTMGDASICHCRMCQKAFGSWGAALVGLDAAGLTWTRGEPALFRSSVIVARGFCRDCGTPLFMAEDGNGIYEMAIGTLDNPNAIPRLSRQVGIESKCGWFDGMMDLPAKTTESDRTPEDMVKLKSLQHPDHDTPAWPADGESLKPRRP